jgi:AraC-like DNA-binding protein
VTTAAATYRELPAPPGLAPWVACAWELRAGPDGHVHRVLPDGCMDVVWDERDGLRAVGPNLTAFLARMAPGAAAVGVRMRPGGAPPVFGVTGEALRDATVPAEDLWGDDARRLAERLHRAPPGADRAHRLLGWLGVRALGSPRPDPLVAAVARRVAGDPRATVAGMADDAGIGARHLRRRVAREVGYGPRRLARVLRLQRAVALAHAAPGAGLADLAARAGYADQAHLSHECRDLAGLPPSRLLAGDG